MIINSMYMKASDRAYYWSRDRDTGIAGIDELMKCVHFRDNREMPADNTDKFYKVRPLFGIPDPKSKIGSLSEFREYFSRRKHGPLFRFSWC